MLHLRNTFLLLPNQKMIMKISKLFILFFFFVCLGSSCNSTSENTSPLKAPAKAVEVVKPDYALVIHGGAGTILRSKITPNKEQAIREALDAALSAGEAVLKAGGSSLDAIEAAIMVMEDAPHFNSAKGAVFTHEGKNELDASIMDGATVNAGAVGGVSIVKNPIQAARAVMENSPHVLLTHEGANTFAKEQGLEIVDPSYFFTQSRWDALQRVKAKEKATGYIDKPAAASKFGTVGAAALDKNGNLAAGTSTGGMTNKRWGRIGDSPIIGAGTYANNKTCAISCTGHGEFFIRYAVAYDISAKMEYGGMPFQDAAEEVVHKKLVAAGGSGGIIGVDKDGNVAMPFNTKGMYRGYLKSTGERVVAIYGEGEE